MGNDPKPKNIEQQAKQQADFCSVFSNPKRVLILWTILNQELSVGAIAEAVDSSPQNVSQHLSVMKSQHIVSSRRNRQTIYYRIDERNVSKHCKSLLIALQGDVNPMYPNTNKFQIEKE